MNKYLVVGIFGLLLFTFSCSVNQKISGCRKYKVGTFRIKSRENNSVTTIERLDTIQTEINSMSKTIIKAHIHWINKCEYELLYQSQDADMSDSITSFVKDHPVRVKILNATGSYYTFDSWIEGVDFHYIDAIFFVK